MAGEEKKKNNQELNPKAEGDSGNFFAFWKLLWDVKASLESARRSRSCSDTLWLFPALQRAVVPPPKRTLPPAAAKFDLSPAGHRGSANAPFKAPGWKNPVSKQLQPPLQLSPVEHLKALCKAFPGPSGRWGGRPAIAERDLSAASAWEQRPRCAEAGPGTDDASALGGCISSCRSSTAGINRQIVKACKA